MQDELKNFDTENLAKFKEEIKRELLSEINMTKAERKTTYCELRKYVDSKITATAFLKNSYNKSQFLSAVNTIIRFNLGLNNIMHIKADQVDDAKKIVDILFSVKPLAHDDR